MNNKNIREYFKNPELDHIFKLDWKRIRLSQLSQLKNKPKTHGTVINEDVWEQWEENFFKEYPQFKNVSSHFKQGISLAMPTAQEFSNKKMSGNEEPPKETYFHHFLIGLRFSLFIGKDSPELLNEADHQFMNFFNYWDIFYTELRIKIENNQKTLH